MGEKDEYIHSYVKEGKYLVYCKDLKWDIRVSFHCYIHIKFYTSKFRDFFWLNILKRDCYVCQIELTFHLKNKKCHFHENFYFYHRTKVFSRFLFM